MTYVVTEMCIGCKHTTCVTVCPVDCFREGANFLAIDPDECVDCGLCEIECPVEAIVSECDLTPENLHCAKLNAELSRIWPPIAHSKPALPDAERWAGVPGKLQHLVRSAR
ncbi:MAG: ferredoxin FdxA [Pseudomonadota bacterium]